MHSIAYNISKCIAQASAYLAVNPIRATGFCIEFNHNFTTFKKLTEASQTHSFNTRWAAKIKNK